MAGIAASHRATAHRRQPALQGSRSLLLAAALLSLGALAPRASASDLLDRVKENPQQARSLCQELRGFNRQGVAALSSQSIRSVAQSQGVSPVEAEVLITYVIGLHCSDVR